MNVVITGGTNGIGRALTETLARQGHQVITCGREIVKIVELNCVSGVRAFSCDLTKDKDVESFMREIERSFTSVDALINSIGTFGAIGSIEDLSSEDWQISFETNFFSVIKMCKFCLPLIRRSSRRLILNFSGGGAFSNFPNYSPYASSKAALVRFSENLASELRSEGIDVLCVAPGFVPTKIHKKTLDAGAARAGQEHYRKTKQKFIDDKGDELKIAIDCVVALISERYAGISGKTISANFDPWKSHRLIDNKNTLMASDLYTLRRINPANLEESSDIKKILNQL